MRSALRLWFPLVAPAVAFSVAGLFGWAIGARVCTSISLGTARLLIGVMSLAMLGVSCLALLSGLDNFRQTPHRHTEDRVEFMALGGVLVSASFVIGTLWFVLNPALLHGCGGVR
jgi:hypothetical protein